MITETYPTMYEEVQLELNLGAPRLPILCWCPRLGVERKDAWRTIRVPTRRMAALAYAKRLADRPGCLTIYTALGDGEPETYKVRSRLKHEVLE